MKHADPTPSLEYIRKLYAPQDDLLLGIAAACEEIGMGIQIGPEEGKMLQMFITLHGVKTIVEVGTLLGYSTVWMVRALPEDGHIYTLNKDPSHCRMARQAFMQAGDLRISMLEGDAHDTLPQLNDKGPFDMIFIDADKLSYNDYLDWAEENVRKYGLIVADNTLLFNTIGLKEPPADVAPSTWHSMQLFNERLANPEKYFSVMLPTKEGLTVAVKLF